MSSGNDLDAARALFESAYDASGFLPERSDRAFGYRFRSVGDASLTLDASGSTPAWSARSTRPATTSSAG